MKHGISLPYIPPHLMEAHGEISGYMIKSILLEIYEFDPMIMDLKMGDYYYAQRTQYTEPFLARGGFVKQFEDADIEKQKKIIELEEEAKDKVVQRRKNKHQATLAKWQVKTFWWLFFIGIIGGGYSIYQIADKIINPKGVVTKEEFEQFKEELAKRPAPVLKDSIK